MNAPYPPDRRWRPAAARLVIGLVALGWLAGCTTFRRPPRHTSLESPQSVLKASLVANFLIVEAQWDKHGPYHFLIDTGSSTTLVTPDLARRYGGRPRTGQGPVRVMGANGQVKLLPPVLLKRIDLGAARFEGVPALIHDLTDLSDHLGLRIDGVLGFPLFRDTLLTLDYVHAEVILTPYGVPTAMPGVTIPFNNDQNTPLIPIQLGAESFVALIDSGSGTALSLNTVGLHPAFRYGPKPGALIATLAGDRLRMIGRLGQPLSIGTYVIENPIADVTDELSSIGGGLLRNFIVTFDQKRKQVTFYRPTFDAIQVPPLRSTGLSFTRTAAYWKVAAVIAGSPAEMLGVQPGDLCSRINDEPVSAWPFARYSDLERSAARVTYTFINGNEEQKVTLPVFELVP